MEKETETLMLSGSPTGDSVPATCIEVVAVAVRRGWKDPRGC